MVASLPKFIDPLALADKNAKIEGQLSLDGFERIAELLFNGGGFVDCRLNFFKEGNLTKISGHLSGEMMLKCQRCLEPLHWRIDAHIKLGVVKSLDMIDRLPEGFEPFLIENEEKIALKDVIEDELLLIIPNVPKHQGNCSAVSQAQQVAGLSSDKLNSIKNPFSILADFKNLENINGSTKK